MTTGVIGDTTQYSVLVAYSHFLELQSLVEYS